MNYEIYIEMLERKVSELEDKVAMLEARLIYLRDIVNHINAPGLWELNPGEVVHRHYGRLVEAIRKRVGG